MNLHLQREVPVSKPPAWLSTAVTAAMACLAAVGISTLVAYGCGMFAARVDQDGGRIYRQFYRAAASMPTGVGEGSYGPRYDAPPAICP